MEIIGKEKEDQKNVKNLFESKKIMKLNGFFMRNIIFGLFVSVLTFVISVILLMYIITKTNIDATLQITIVSMVATFILTTSKTLIDRITEVIIYTVRLLGEEQRGLNKKMGIEVSEVEFEEINAQNVSE